MSYKRVDIEIQRLAVKYYIDGKSSSEVAKELPVSSSAVINWVRRDGEHVRTISETSKGRPGFWTGKKQPEYVKIKRSLAQKGKLRGPASETHRKNISKARIGMKMSEEFRKGCSERSKKRWTPEHQRKMFFACMAKSHGETKIELKVRKQLDELGIIYFPQYQMGWYFCDFFLIELGLVIECDGVYWHSRPEIIVNDAEKDKYIRNLGYDIIRIPENEIKSPLFNVEDVIRAFK